MEELFAEQLAREDQMPHLIATENASVKTKSHRVYRVIDELAAVARCPKPQSGASGTLATTSRPQ